MFSHCYNDPAATESFFDLLAAQGVSKLHIISDKTVIVEHDYDWWTLHDNGGELNIEKVNFPDTMRSIPYTSVAGPISAMTMVYRVVRAMRGKQIDYDAKLDLGVNLMPSFF